MLDLKIKNWLGITNLPHLDGSIIKYKDNIYVIPYNLLDTFPQDILVKFKEKQYEFCEDNNLDYMVGDEAEPFCSSCPNLNIGYFVDGGYKEISPDKMCPAEDKGDFYWIDVFISKVKKGEEFIAIKVPCIVDQSYLYAFDELGLLDKLPKIASDIEFDKIPQLIKIIGNSKEELNAIEFTNKLYSK
jgi:hypothetical protein